MAYQTLCSDPLYLLKFISHLSLLQPQWLMFLKLAQHAHTLGICLSGSSAWGALFSATYGSLLYALSVSSAISSESTSLTPLHKIASLNVTHCPFIFSILLHSTYQSLMCYVFICLYVHFLSPAARNKLYPPQILFYLYFCLNHKTVLGTQYILNIC